MLIFGLGNPGEKYSETRHNVGYFAIDILAKRMRVKIKKHKFDSLYGEFSYKNEKHFLIKPLSYMNKSGEVVAKWKRKKKAKIKNIFIVYDDIDLKLGTVRIRKKGGSGTHNGLKSIIDKIGSTNFPRLRIGIKGEGYNIEDLSEFVLSNFRNHEKKVLDDVLKKLPEIFINIFNFGIDKTMNKFNQKNLVPSENEGTA